MYSEHVTESGQKINVCHNFTPTEGGEFQFVFKNERQIAENIYPIRSIKSKNMRDSPNRSGKFQFLFDDKRQKGKIIYPIRAIKSKNMWNLPERSGKFHPYGVLFALFRLLIL